MKLARTILLLLLAQYSVQAQTTAKPDETFINANADASDKVTDNSTLNFYTIDELKLGDLLIPIHTKFSATVRIIEGRAFLKVSSLKIRDEIHTVDWRVVGPDYKEGIPIIEQDQSIELYEDQRITFKAFPK